MTDELTLPAPMTPADSDLRGYEFMPLYGDVLFRSSFFTRATPEEFRAAMKLWWAAWWEVPAASLPNNERDLSVLAGVSLRAWRKMRREVLTNWVLCADDRWYHPFLADIACSAFSKRKTQSLKGLNGARKRWNNNGHEHSTGISTGIAPAINTDSTTNATATLKDSAGNSKGSKEKLIPPYIPPGGTATPTPAAQSFARAQRQIAEQRTAAAHAAPPPGGSVAAFTAQHLAKKPGKFEDVEETDP